MQSCSTADDALILTYAILGDVFAGHCNNLIHLKWKLLIKHLLLCTTRSGGGSVCMHDNWFIVQSCSQSVNSVSATIIVGFKLCFKVVSISV